MQTQKPQPKDLLCAYKMADVCPCIAAAASVAAAPLREDCVLMRVYGIFHHEAPRPRHRHAVSCDTRREDTVKHVDTVTYARKKIVRRTDPMR